MQTLFTPGLYIIAGPIGNLGDISLRALEILRLADVVYAEDTRVTGKLLAAHGIQVPMRSLREAMPTAQFERAATDVVDRLRNGEIVAYLSDAGTPGVSDPGNRLVGVVRRANLPVIPVPGASALTTLLSVAGVPVTRPIFVGFLPKKKGRQTLVAKLLQGLQEAFCDSIILFESPERLLKTLTEFQSVKKDICVIVGRELTKKFEEITAGSLTEVIDHYQQKPAVKGELVILVHMPYN